LTQSWLGGLGWGWGGGWFAEVSTEPAPAVYSSEHPAKISIKLPETLQCPHTLHNRDGEGSQLVEVTMLFKGVFLGSQVENCSLNKTRKFSIFIVCTKSREGL
jgi:hypothetical protein